MEAPIFIALGIRFLIPPRILSYNVMKIFFTIRGQVWQTF
ncbi:hypothetical protein CPK_ORF00666 [Chlamydia pneumoniae LPCoLN]|uniref:Uncharacterized protein n=1 Tax=Chlamydia pneumoniae TaxID=83558 RepID=Q9K231_CHLPN|nr:hypothetical protein CP_0621 [Chlamydia pneumoniae AR39]ACZ33135.1 hypothetical protein CPK_ORF00666 [Chlamydia pneumoniae LPCoLN]